MKYVGKQFSQFTYKEWRIHLVDRSKNWEHILAINNYNLL